MDAALLLVPPKMPKLSHASKKTIRTLPFELEDDPLVGNVVVEYEFYDPPYYDFSLLSNE